MRLYWRQLFCSSFVLFFLCLAVIALVVWKIDRLWSSWAYQNLHDIALFSWLTHIPDPFVALASVGLIVAALAAWVGWRPGPRTRTLLACAVAIAIAVMVKEQLKFAFGRTWPETWVDGNPSWIRDGLFLFQPFHGGKGWASFPSGHTAVIAAPAAVLWRAVPRWRWLWASLVGAVAIGLLGANYHWVSDVLAGACVGIASGIGALALVGRCRSDKAVPRPSPDAQEGL